MLCISQMMLTLHNNSVTQIKGVVYNMINKACQRKKKRLTAGRRFETAVPDEVMITAGLWDPLA